MRRRSTEDVFHAVDIQAAGAEARRRTRCSAGGVAAHQHVHSVEHARLEHVGLCVGRHHLLARSAENRDAAGRVRAIECFSDGHSRRDAHRALCAVLVAVEWPRCATQSIVLEDDAEVRASLIALIARDERGLEVGHAHGYLESVLLQIGGEFLDGAGFLESDLGMPRNVVGKRQQFLLHQLAGARCRLVARRIGC